MEPSMAEMEDSSVYRPSSSPSPIAWSLRSDLSDDSGPVSPTASTCSNPEDIDEFTDSSIPLHDSSIIVLENPYAKPMFESAWQNLVNSSDQRSLLQEYIRFISPSVKPRKLLDDQDDEDNYDVSANLLETALTEESVRRLVVERFTDAQIKDQLERLAGKPYDFAPLEAEVQDFLDRAVNDPAARVNISTALVNKVNLYAWVVPKQTALFRTRKHALVALLALADGVLRSPEDLRNQIMSSRDLSVKLGLAFRKLIMEATTRELGSLKRFGLKEDIAICIRSWTAHTSMGDVDWMELLT